MDSNVQVDWFQEYDELSKSIKNKQIEYWEQQYDRTHRNNFNSLPSNRYQQRDQWVSSNMHEFLPQESTTKEQTNQKNQSNKSRLYNSTIEQILQPTEPQKVLVPAKQTYSNTELDQLNQQLSLTRSQVESMRYNIINKNVTQQSGSQYMEINDASTYPVYTDSNNKQMQEFKVACHQDEDAEVIENPKYDIQLSKKAIQFKDQNNESITSQTKSELLKDESLVKQDFTFVEFDENEKQNVSQISVSIPQKSILSTNDTNQDNILTITLSHEKFSSPQQQTSTQSMLNQLQKLKKDDSKIVNSQRVIQAFTSQKKCNQQILQPFPKNKMYVQKAGSPLQINIDMPKTDEQLKNLLKLLKPSTNAMNFSSI